MFIIDARTKQTEFCITCVTCTEGSLLDVIIYSLDDPQKGLLTVCVGWWIDEVDKETDDKVKVGIRN